MTAPASFDDVVETFTLLDEWDDRYRFLIEIGRDLTGLSDSEKSPANKVEGCTSQVWLIAQPDANRPGALSFVADSDAHIVKGLVGLLILLYSGKTPQEILAIDARGQLGRLDLEAHLSPSRANGLFSMVKRIRAIAQAAVAT